MRLDWPAIGRELLVSALFFLPRRNSIRLERWLRGRQERRKLESADFVIVSFPNSGRTWLHVLLLRFFQGRSGYDDATFADMDDLRDLDPRAPQIHFTHDNYLRDYTGEGRAKAAYRGKKVVLLVRDPADVCVSQFHQWRHRMRRRKKLINAYPADPQLSLFAFTFGTGAAGEVGTLSRVVNFLNEWADALPDLPDLLMIRYEDLVADAEATLMRLLTFLGQQPTRRRVREAVEYASLANMRQLEQRGGRLFRPGRWRLAKPQAANQMKARRAKVGGYRADFSEGEAALIDAVIDQRLATLFGYGRGVSADVGSRPISESIRVTASERSLDTGLPA